MTSTALVLHAVGREHVAAQAESFRAEFTVVRVTCVIFVHTNTFGPTPILNITIVPWCVLVCNRSRP